MEFFSFNGNIITENLKGLFKNPRLTTGQVKGELSSLVIEDFGKYSRVDKAFIPVGGGQELSSYVMSLYLLMTIDCA